MTVIAMEPGRDLKAKVGFNYCYVCGKILLGQNIENYMVLEDKMYKVCEKHKGILSLALYAMNQLQSLERTVNKLEGLNEEAQREKGVVL